ncbi:ubl carboxyl-terminal hydrolase 18 [Lepisosteus oculatus]|uniref:Ubiquitin specific peptidase 18 n=1 Tax=Lepisosteus oculatus TaxID=7918 RepID=W5NIK2_LEPOC|nr:PREDICTED: ubl carboxyl-terminal hydrolase 18 [Lepisosteus oculatus]
MLGRCFTRSYSFQDSMSSTRLPGLMGLLNYRLSCCVNSVLQSFFATEEFTEKLDRWNGPSTAAEEKCNTPLQLQRVLRVMQKDRSQTQAHRDFLYCLHLNHIRFYVQHDADEVFLLILNLIQQQMSDTNLAQEIRDLYKTEVRQHLKCLSCNSMHDVPNNSYFVSFPLSVYENCQMVENCFQFFFRPQKLTDRNKCYCNYCGEKKTTEQVFKLTSLPKVLVIHLKRFQCSGSTRKLNCKVSFPEILDFQKILHEDQHELNKGQMYIYELFAVIVHSGTAMFGHYTAYIKSPGEQTWYHADDSSISTASWADVKSTYGSSSGSRSAYMLLYRKIEEETSMSSQSTHGSELMETESK